MLNNNMTSWFFEGGSVTVPKRLIGLSDQIGLDHKMLGELVYLLYCDSKIAKDDKYSASAVKSLRKKGFIKVDEVGTTLHISYDPLFLLIEETLGISQKKEPEPAVEQRQKEPSYSEMIKNIEAETGAFLSVREKMEIQEALQQYLWDNELIKELYVTYKKHFKRQYPFTFFAKMAYSSNVKDSDSFTDFKEKLNYVDYKISEVKRRLGHRQNFSEVEKETYLKWVNLWKFSHEMIMLAVDQTLSAKDPTFKYIDKILENWNAEGVKSREDQLMRENKHKEEQGARKSKLPKTKEPDTKPRNLNRFIE